MELVKTSEDFRRTYDDVGQSSDIINSVQYSLKDGDKQVGNINVYQGGYSINVNKQGGLDVLKAELEAIFVAVV